jgi:cytochrome oxidase Cu insertion factor (SCO1/SenC/PrrC family)
VRWEHFSDVERFQLTDQSGQEFDSNRLNGRVYAVSFFFATCPTICRQVNAQIKRLNEKLADEDIEFVSMSVDPETDSPEVLAQYAREFNAVPGRWNMLTGPFHRIRRVGEHVFRVVIDKETHTDNLFLVDKWGRYRDRFKWDDSTDMERFVQVARELAAESAPPLGQTFNTRNLLPLVSGQQWDSIPWLRDFTLFDQDGRDFFSRELTGRVWIASFFFSHCPTICPEQNAYLAALYQRRKLSSPSSPLLRLVSISTDPQRDTPERLREYGSQFQIPFSDWTFCTGDLKLVRRISAEFFGVSGDADHHSSLLLVVDKWGRVRGRFDWHDPQEELAMLELISQLEQETRPEIWDKVLGSGGK